MGAYARAQQGDAEALRALTRRHLPLVQALSRRFADREDAFQQGCVGLVKAIRGFREEAGYQFSTYAVPVILGEMRRTRRDPLGWRRRAALRRAGAFREAQLRRTGQEPPLADIARAAGVEKAELMLLMEMDQPPVYDDTGELLAALPDPGGEKWLLRLMIRDTLERLPGEDTWLLRQRFVLGCSQTQLARALGVSQSQLSRREKRARQHFCQAWGPEL